MIRSGKKFAIALVAVLAMGAVVASAAHAEGDFEAESYPKTVSGGGEGNQTFTFGKENSVTCESSTYDGVLTEESTEFVFSAEYSKCKFGGAEAMVTMNGCTFKDTPLKLYMGDLWEVETHLECPAGKKVEIDESNCTITIPAQLGYSASLYRDETTKPKKMKLLGSVDKFIFIVHKKNGFCNLTEGEHTDGVYDGEGSLTGAEIG